MGFFKSIFRSNKHPVGSNAILTVSSISRNTNLENREPIVSQAA